LLEKREMNKKKVARYAAFFTAIFAILALPVYAPFVDAYPAQITADGKLELKGFRGSFELPVDETFVALVPNKILPEKYENVEFTGRATAARGRERGIIKLDGILNVSKNIFWVKFDVEKPKDPEFHEGTYFANGELNITIVEATLPQPEINWVLMKGNITEFNGTAAFGSLMAHAKIGGTNNWTKVHGVFTQQPRPKGPMTSGTYNYSFYIVTLVNATMTELDYDGSALYIEGKWNVYNRTCTITNVDDEEKTIVITMKPVVEEAFGKLNVTLDSKPSPIPPQIPWRVQGDFELNITGFGTTTGDVLFYHVKPAKPFERGIPMGDIDNDRAVNILDITPIAKAFGAKLGTPKYNFDLDLNSDFVINIIDISTAATEYGEEY